MFRNTPLYTFVIVLIISLFACNSPPNLLQDTSVEAHTATVQIEAMEEAAIAQAISPDLNSSNKRTCPYDWLCHGWLPLNMHCSMKTAMERSQVSQL